MPRIFISYRRADSITATGRIYDRLVAAFGADQVFKDVDDIPLGADFRRVLEAEVTRCDVLLVVIGTHWLTITQPDGTRRLDDPADFVRIEVETGLKRDNPVVVVPVLVQGAAMPNAENLPAPLQELAFRNAAPVRDDPDFSRDMARLIDQLRELDADRVRSGISVASPVDAPATAATATTATASARGRLPVLPIAGVASAVLLLAAILLWNNARQRQTANNATHSPSPTTVQLSQVSTTVAPFTPTGVATGAANIVTDVATDVATAAVTATATDSPGIVETTPTPARTRNQSRPTLRPLSVTLQVRPTRNTNIDPFPFTTLVFVPDFDPSDIIMSLEDTPLTFTGEVNNAVSPTLEYTFSAEAGTRVDLTATSNIIDPVVSLFDAEGNLLAQNDDVEDNALGLRWVDARISDFTLPAGDIFTVRVQSTLQGEGAFTLTVERAD